MKGEGRLSAGGGRNPFGFLGNKPKKAQALHYFFSMRSFSSPRIPLLSLRFCCCLQKNSIIIIHPHPHHLILLHVGNFIICIENQKTKTKYR